MADIPHIALAELRELVTDGEELSKGARLYDDGGLEHLARFENKLFADARGSGVSPYKVQLAFEGGKPKARCTCRAAWSRPFCKHGAALVVAWARAPESFAVADVSPVPLGPTEAKKKSVKKGKVDASALMLHGVEQVATLVRELAVSGVASLGPERPSQIRALGESLRESRLRRLSGRTVALADKLELAVEQDPSFDPGELAEVLGDLLLTARKIEKWVGGETLDPKYVEELVGKTWTKKDRAPIEGLELVEYAFLSKETPDGFVIRESRFFDLASGEHFSEKQILPGFLAKRAEPKRSWMGKVLVGAGGTTFPTFAPVRLDLASPGEERALGDGSLSRLAERALGDVTAVLGRLQERKKDVFAPDLLPVAVRVDTVFAEGPRMQVVDDASSALFLPDDPGLEVELASALRGVTLVALLGDVAFDGALPTLFPLAALVRTVLGLELRSLAAIDVAALRAASKVKVAATRTRRSGALASSWAETARAAGLSHAAITLGEVREEMAALLATGLGALVPRSAEPLSSRLRELGLDKQADLLDATALRLDPAEKLDDFVKVHQVLGIALARLAGAAEVDRGALGPVPTYESVLVRRTDEHLEPRRVASLVAEGRLNRYQAAVLYAAWYESIPPEELARSIYPTWADGSASLFVARAFASRPAEAIAAAKRVLTVEKQKTREGQRHAFARVARITALRVLEAVASEEAEALLVFVATEHPDAALRGHADRALRTVSAKRRGTATRPRSTEERTVFRQWRDRLLSASRADDRRSAMMELVKLGDLDAIPFLRASFAGDVAASVREHAAYALASIGDVESVETFVRMVKERELDDRAATTGARALGLLGDVRGIDALLDAWEEGWKTPTIAESIKHIGSAALEPLLDRVIARPELTEKKTAVTAVAGLPHEDLAAALLARLEALAERPDFAVIAKALVPLAAEDARVLGPFTAKVYALRPALLEKKGLDASEKSLLRRLAKHAE